MVWAHGCPRGRRHAGFGSLFWHTHTHTSACPDVTHATLSAARPHARARHAPAPTEGPEQASGRMEGVAALAFLPARSFVRLLLFLAKWVWVKIKPPGTPDVHPAFHCAVQPILGYPIGDPQPSDFLPRGACGFQKRPRRTELGAGGLAGRGLHLRARQRGDGGAPGAQRLGGERVGGGVRWSMDGATGLKKPVPKWDPGKWKHGPKLA